MDSPLALLTLIVGAGVAAQWIASRLRFPALLLLLATGLLLGPIAEEIEPAWALEPQRIFGDLLDPIVSLAVAVVLFEGGLSLELKEARHVGVTLWRLIFSGFILGFALTTVLGVYLGGLSWSTAAVLGAILMVTGPTVILPMLRRARIALRPATLLKWEGIVNDPVGALLALFVVNTVGLVATEGGSLSGLLVTFLWTGVVSALLGTLAGYALGKALDRGLIAENLKSPVILAAVLVVFAVSDTLYHEMGLLAVTIMGIVLANTENHSLEDIRRFKEQITTLLVSTLFIVLSANLEVDALQGITGRPLLLILAVVFIVRPIVVLVATTSSSLPFSERALVGWIAPRGVVAAAVAATLQRDLEVYGVDDYDQLVPIVFGVIAATVVLHGLSIRPFARRLGLAATEGNGILIVGASVWVVSLAQALARAGASVVLADTRYRRVSRARQEGLEVHHGDVLAEEAAMELPMERVSWVLAATDDDHYNALSCLRFVPELGREAIFQLTASTSERKTETEAHMSGQTPWGERGSFRWITGRFWKGASFKVTSLSASFSFDEFCANNPDAFPMFSVYQGRLKILPEGTKPPEGSKVIYLS